MSTEESNYQSVTHSADTYTSETVNVSDTCDRDIKVEPDDDMITEAKINEEDVDVHQYARFYPQDVVISLQQTESPLFLVNPTPNVSATKGHATLTVQDTSSAAPPALDGPSPSSSQTAACTPHPNITETEGSPIEGNKSTKCGDNDKYTQLDTHNLTDTKKKRFQCQQCPASFTWDRKSVV